MREILFRGKRVDNGEWVYGDLLHFRVKNVPSLDKYAIVKTQDNLFASIESFEVNANTIGQFTGLLDKNGKKIFEGDIVEISCKYKGKVEFEDCGIVKYKDSSFVADIFTSDEESNFPCIESYCNDETEQTVIVIGIYLRRCY